jgi:propane monooxygenase reductase subunit
VPYARASDGGDGCADVRGRVSRKTPLTDHITLLAVDVPRSLTFDAGQYVDIVIPEHGEPRSYSMMNLPGAGRLEFLIKLNPNGELPDLLSGDVRVGTELTLCGPYGSCVLDPAAIADEYLLIAGGSGIAPMLSLLRAIERSPGRGSAVALFYGSSSPGDLLLLDTIADVGAGLDRFAFVPILSGVPEHRGWDGARGFVHEAVDGWLRTSSDGSERRRQVYMAGPPAMIDAAFAVLTERHGLDVRDIAFDQSPAHHRSAVGRMA